MQDKKDKVKTEVHKYKETVFLLFTIDLGGYLRYSWSAYNGMSGSLFYTKRSALDAARQYIERQFRHSNFVTEEK